MYEFTKPNPTIREFREQFEKVAEECSADGEKVSSHNLSADVRVICVDRDGSNDYELVGIDVDTVPGCGCWAAPIIAIRRKQQSTRDTDQKEEA